MSSEQAVAVLSSQAARAAKLAEAMTRDLHATGIDQEWTAQDVINVALGRGLDALETALRQGNNDGA